MTADAVTPNIRLLGQGGLRLALAGATVYVDPYLSDSVRLLDAPDLVRLIPTPFDPAKVDDADWVLITHDHLDHCDPHTLLPLAQASPGARFLGPPPALALLAAWGLDPVRLVPAEEAWTELAPGLRVRAVPAAHPDIARDARGRLAAVGYVLDDGERRLYLAGDTSVTAGLIAAVSPLGPFALGFLPVNECNFFRQRRGILGNMSVREACALARELGVEILVPVHWDMFAANAVTPEEIRAVHAAQFPEQRLLLVAAGDPFTPGGKPWP